MPPVNLPVEWSSATSLEFSVYVSLKDLRVFCIKIMSYVINIVLIFTDDVTICMEIDPGIHIDCIRFCSLKSGVTEVVSKLC